MTGRVRKAELAARQRERIEHRVVGDPTKRHHHPHGVVRREFGAETRYRCVSPPA